MFVNPSIGFELAREESFAHGQLAAKTLTLRLLFSKQKPATPRQIFKERKRDRLKRFFFRKRCQEPGIDDASTLLHSSIDKASCASAENEDESIVSSIETSYKKHTEKKFGTVRNILTEEDFTYPRNTEAMDKTRNHSQTIRQRVNSRFRDLSDLMKNIVSSETLFEMPQNLQTALTSLLEDRSRQSSYKSTGENLNVPGNLRTEPKPGSKETESKFCPIYDHSFDLSPPPKSLPRELYPKWERRQMMRHTARKYDHEKWKSKNLLLTQESKHDTPQTAATSENYSIFKEATTSMSLNFFENMSKVFSTKPNSSASSKATMKNGKSFLPSNYNFGNISGFFSFKSGISSEKMPTGFHAAYNDSEEMSYEAKTLDPYKMPESPTLQFQRDIPGKKILRDSTNTIRGPLSSNKDTRSMFMPPDSEYIAADSFSEFSF